MAYGTGHMAKEHDSLMNDFSNVLWAWGGDYFSRGKAVGGLGLVDPGPLALNSARALQATSFYRDLLKIAHPGSTGWDWTALSEAFGAGQVAMAPLWHEFTGDLEKGPLKGKVGFSTLPRGPARSANMYGGTGLAINARRQQGPAAGGVAVHRLGHQPGDPAVEPEEHAPAEAHRRDARSTRSPRS